MEPWWCQANLSKHRPGVDPTDAIGCSLIPQPVFPNRSEARCAPLTADAVEGESQVPVAVGTPVRKPARQQSGSGATRDLAGNDANRNRSAPLGTYRHPVDRSRKVRVAVLRHQEIRAGQLVRRSRLGGEGSGFRTVLQGVTLINKYPKEAHAAMVRDQGSGAAIITNRQRV